MEGMAKFERSPIGKYELRRVSRSRHSGGGFDALKPMTLNRAVDTLSHANSIVTTWADKIAVDQFQYTLHAVQEV